MRCNKRIVLGPYVETYCQLELGHDPKRPCSITRDQSYPLGTIVGVDHAGPGSEKTVITRQIAGGKDELKPVTDIRDPRMWKLDSPCLEPRLPEIAEHPAPLSRVDSVKNP